MRLSKGFLRILVLLMTFVMLCPAGALAQSGGSVPEGFNRLVAYQENLTLSVYAEGRQVTVNGKTTPETQVSLVITRSLDGDRCYLDQTLSDANGLYQFLVDMDSGDYQVNVTSNGIYRQESLKVNDARQAAVSVRVEGLKETLLAPKNVEIYDRETTLLTAVRKALDDNSVPYEVVNGMINWIGKDQEKDWQWLVNGTGGMALPTTPLKQNDQIVMVSGQLWDPTLTRLSLEGEDSVKVGTEISVTLEKYTNGRYLTAEDQKISFAGSTQGSQYTDGNGQVSFRADKEGTYEITAQTDGNLIRPVPLVVVVSKDGPVTPPVEDVDTCQVRMRIEGYRGTVFDSSISFKPEDYKNKTSGKYEITDPDGKKYSFSYPTVLMATIVAWNKKNIRDNKVTSNDNYVARMAGEEEFDFRGQHPTCGWLVRVNDRLINQGVGVWEIDDGDTVEWFYGDTKSSFGYLDLSSTSLNTGDTLEVEVTAKSNEGVDGGNSSTRKAVSGATVHVGSQTYTTDGNGKAEITMNKAGSFTVYADKVDPGSSYKGYNFPLVARTEKASVTVKGPEVAVPIEEVIPVTDYTDYNQKALAALEKVTPEQLAGARLPEDTPAVNPENTEPTILKAKDGVQLTIPPGALRQQSSPVQFSVEVGQVTVPPRAELGALVLDPIKYQRQFGLVGQGQEGVEFAAPVTLTFPISSEDLPEGVSTRQLAIYWWNSAKGDWAKQGGVYDPLAKTLSLTIYHFSTYAVMADTAPAPRRIAGQERFDTANLAAAYGWKAGADQVLLANAFAYSDVLAAVPLAYKNQAPILLTEATELTPATFEQLQKLKPKKVILIGGTSVISQGIQDRLNQLYGAENVARYGGKDLYETAALIAQALGTTGQAVIANGGPASYADALAVSSYAGYHGIPILFTERTALPAATQQALTEQKVTRTLVVGGSFVVPEEIVQQLPEAVRYGGRDIYETATKIAEGLELNSSKVYVATGLNFADALAAGNLAARTLSPILLVDTGIPGVTSDFLLKHQAEQPEIIIFGGEGIIRGDQESSLRSALTPSP